MSSPNKDEMVTIVHQEITHDFVLDVYESSKRETDPDKREAIIETARVLSQSIGDFLVAEDEEK
jgi:hypothetical protein